MESEKRLQALQSENEFLQLQLEDLNRAVSTRDKEISFLGDEMERSAALQSKIAGNMLEIEQIRLNLADCERRKDGTEQLVEDLEDQLLQDARQQHAADKELRNLKSEKAELGLMNRELEELAAFYPKLSGLRSELAEARSALDSSDAENAELKAEILELKALVAVLRNKTLE